MPPRRARGGNLFKRLISNFEPILQHHGVIYTFIIIFVLLNFVVFFITAAPAWRKVKNMDQFKNDIFLRLFVAIARGGGAMLNLNSALIILVASRTLMTFLRQTALNLYVPFDKAMPAFHSLVGNFLVFSCFLHVLGHIVRYSKIPLTRTGLFSDVSLGITGGILTLILVGMRITSALRVRQKSFETFSLVHYSGFIVYFVLLYLHGSHSGTMKTWMYVTLPLAIYIIDRLIRLMREHGSHILIGRQAANIKGSDIVCLRIPRTFTYLAGQYCDLKVPLVSSLEWHPFTIASSPHESEMLFYIKINGDWTKRLYRLFKERVNDVDDIQIHVRGPYGAPAQHVGQYDHVVLISGGVGATPMCSITKYAHHWILNYTQRGAAASNSVSAAFTRNQSVQDTPTASLPGTPVRQPSSMRRSRTTSRPLSRNQSSNFSRNMSHNVSRNFSRTGSRAGSRPLSRSGSGRLERFNSSRMPGNTPTMSRSTSGRAEYINTGRPLPAHLSRSGSDRMDRPSSGSTMDRAGSNRTADSVNFIIQDQRKNQPYGPTPISALAASSANSTPPPVGTPNTSDSVVIPEGMLSTVGSLNPPPPERKIDPSLFTPEEVDGDFTRPDDYDEELGNPTLPIPDRRAQSGFLEERVASSNRQSTFEITNDFDSQMVFDEDEEHVEEEHTTIQRGDVVNGVMDERFSVDDFEEEEEEEEEGLDLEDEILRDEHTASNAYNLLGMSFGPLAMMRHLDVMDAKKLRTSLVRTSANLMNDAIEGASLGDRILFYMHTVTVNWFMLWIMFLRFTLVFIGLAVLQFKLKQNGLGVFESVVLNIVDLALAVLVSAPILSAVFVEIYVKTFPAYISDNIANSFDLFVLLPLLLACIVLQALNLAGIGEDVNSVSIITVCAIWPVVSMFILWRVTRTIGSRVTLAPSYRSSHAQTKSLDYIWVTKTHEDDTWVLDELLPIADSNIVRLHRFITRHGPKTEPWMLDYEKVPLKTTYSRPDWDEVFGGIVERSKSGTVIGVFFCGPDSMARMVQQAAMKAMAKSMDNAYARGYFTKKSSTNVGRNESGAVSDPNTSMLRGAGVSLRSIDFGRQGSLRAGFSNGPQSSQRVVEEDTSAYGCAVRFAIRVENFS